MTERPRTGIPVRTGRMALVSTISTDIVRCRYHRRTLRWYRENEDDDGIAESGRSDIDPTKPFGLLLTLPESSHKPIALILQPDVAGQANSEPLSTKPLRFCLLVRPKTAWNVQYGNH
jgi:hypothetical protein